VLDPERIVATRTVLGGSAPERVRDHSSSLTQRHDEATRWREEHRAHARQAEVDLVAAARARTVESAAAAKNF
jgi:argininosuccinate lyase